MLKFNNPNQEIDAVMRAYQSGLSEEFCSFAKTYLFATENLVGGFDALKSQAGVSFYGKKVLACASSGDFKLSATLNGAEQVDLFDINLLTKYVVDLKESMVKNLPFDKSMEVFNSQNPMPFLETIAHLSNKMEITSKFYWQMESVQMMAAMKAYGKPIPSPFGSIIGSYDLGKIPYLANANKYQELQNKKISKSEFYCEDVQHLPVQLQGKKYDIIYLSNIATYLHMMYEDTFEVLKAYNNTVIQPFSNLLNPGGHILISYVYGLGTETSAASPCAWINHIDKRIEAFGQAPDMEYQEVSFPAYYDKAKRGLKDKFVMVKKVR